MNIVQAEDISLSIPSPCIGRCAIEDDTGLCPGCARTRDEITAWQQAPPAVLAEFWSRLPARRARMGLAMHRVGWRVEDLRSFVVDTLQFGGGTWVCGAYGAVAEFCVGEGEPIDLRIDGNTVSARTPRGAISFRLSEHMRTLAFGFAADPVGTDVIVLTVKRGAVGRPPGLALAGPDEDAIDAAARTELLYDFGLAGVIARFGIRTAQSTLIERLNVCRGLEWPAFLAAIGTDILRASPTRVVRNPIGRIEVFTPIPAPTGVSPLGPHTHFLPEFLGMGGDLPPTLALPEVYAPCAVHYPDKSPAMPTEGHAPRRG